MGNSTIWMRMAPRISKLTQSDLCTNSTVAYKQAALNAIAYLMKVCHPLLGRAAIFIVDIRLLSKIGYSAYRHLCSLYIHWHKKKFRQLENKLVSPPALWLWTTTLFWHCGSSPDLLLSAAPVESHVGAIVVCKNNFYEFWKIWTCVLQDSPNACVTLAIPTGIFEHVRVCFKNCYGF